MAGSYPKLGVLQQAEIIHADPLTPVAEFKEIIKINLTGSQGPCHHASVGQRLVLVVLVQRAKAGTWTQSPFAWAWVWKVSIDCFFSIVAQLLTLATDSCVVLQNIGNQKHCYRTKQKFSKNLISNFEKNTHKLFSFPSRFVEF